MELSLSSRYGNTVRSFSGCWTCRLRRKKCDEKRPVCDTCAGLYITCHYEQEKPDWMDGGHQQDEMLLRLKREVKEMANHRRRGDRAALLSKTSREVSSRNAAVFPLEDTNGLVTPIVIPSDPTFSSPNGDTETVPGTPATRPPATVCLLNNSGKNSCKSVAFAHSDTFLLTFYLETVFPFMFPFYRPSLLQGCRSWILEMAITSPVVRKATLCQSSYFFSLAQQMNNSNRDWEGVISQTKEAFEMLRDALQVISGSDINNHLHGAVRILASIMQVQRFEIAISSFDNCQAHLNAALALFIQLLNSHNGTEPHSTFATLIHRLGPNNPEASRVPSAEQTGLRFSSALLVLDDIVASTILQQQPKLYEHLRSLLGVPGDSEPLVDLESTVGVQNWALLEIGEISALDAWKEKCKVAGNLDVMELVRRAAIIKASLESQLAQLEADSTLQSGGEEGLLGILNQDLSQKRGSDGQTMLITRVWAHAALIYLSIVVSGWQPAGDDTRYQVSRILGLLTEHISPPAILRTMAWPFCVAGCLAGQDQRCQFRYLVERLHPHSVFGTLRKALAIMEDTWTRIGSENHPNRNLSMCFQSPGCLGFMLLV
ncbi:unnamed protein product [Clonostachys byssicola]|uniref:Zn(2)-C6 fungal-type domain-containing protein n=1 Tax=Clonostachys byssicola TaxID=160290 RepID=A0A9N9UNA0_9HYPO|nr:unnamed protein product [Clonostachys byssicola]